MTKSLNNIYNKDFIKRFLDNKKLHILLVSFLVFLSCIFFINQRGMIYLTGDETAQVGIAAYTNGYYWAGTFYATPYYPYGYSLIFLNIIMRFSSNFFVFYNSTIILNSLMIALGVPLAYSICRKIAKNSSHSFLLLISFVSAVFPSNIGKANLALGESLLTLIFWLLTYLFFSIIEKITYYKIVAIVSLLIYSYTIHQRFLGVLIAGLLVLFFILIRDKSLRKQLIVFLTFFILCFFLQYYLKAFLLKEIWPNANLVNHNDYSGQIWKLASFFTNLSSLLSLMRAMLGQAFYFLSSTLLIGGIYFIDFFNRFKKIKLKEKETGYIPFLFIFLALFFSYGVSVIFMSHPARMDHVFYGRYIEVLFGPTIIIGLIYLKEHPLSRKLKTIIVASYSVLTAAAACVASYANITHGYMTYNIIAFLPFHQNSYMEMDFAAIFTVAVIFFLMLTSSKEKNRMFTLVAVSIYWIYVGNMFVTRELIPFEDNYKSFFGLANILHEEKEEIYFWGPEGYAMSFQILQTLNFDKPILYLSDEDFDLMDEKDGKLFMISSLNKLLKNQSHFLIEENTGDNIFIASYSESPVKSNALILSKKSFYTNYPQDEGEDFPVSDGINNNHLQYGPMLYLEEGEYIWYLDLEMEESINDKIGTVDITLDGEVCFLQDIFKEDFDENGILTLKIPFSFILNNEISDESIKKINEQSNISSKRIEVRVYTYEGAIVRVLENAISRNNDSKYEDLL